MGITINSLLGGGNQIIFKVTQSIHGQARTRNQASNSKFHLLTRQVQHHTGPAFFINELTKQLLLIPLPHWEQWEGK